MLLLVIPWSCSERGGVSTVVNEVSRQWRKENTHHKVVVDNWRSNHPVIKDEETFFRIGIFCEWNGLFRFAKWLVGLPIDIWNLRKFLFINHVAGINFHYPGLNAAGVALLKRLKIYKGTLILSFHGTDVRPAKNYYEKILWQLIWDQTDAVTACSHSLRDTLARLHPACCQYLSVAYNGVDTSLFCSKDISDISTYKEKYFVSVGGYIPGKGHNILIDSFANIKYLTNANLVIIGATGYSLSAIQDKINALGIKDRITLLRDLPPKDVANLVKHAVCLIQPSLMESFGLAVIEAAACGIPVAISDVGGHREIVQHGITGLLFEPNSSGACAAAILELIKQPDEANKRAEILREQVLMRFSWSKLSIQLHDLLTRGK